GGGVPRHASGGGSGLGAGGRALEVVAMSSPERPLVSRLFPQADSVVSDLSSARLPADMEEAAAQRLGALALVVSIIPTILGTVAQFAAEHAALGPRIRLSFIVADIAVSFLLYAAI